MNKNLVAITDCDHDDIEVESKALVKEGLEAAGEDFRMLVLPDHPTPICMRTHSSDSVPYLLYDSTDLQQHDWKYNEAEGESSGNYVACGHEIIDYLFGRKTC